MKQIIKKIGAALLVAIFLAVNVLPSVGAFAADQKGSITVKNTVAGKTYNLYKVFDLTYKGENKDKNVSYTIAQGWEDFFKTGDGAKYITDQQTGANGETLNPIIVNGKVQYINITETNVPEFAQAALAFAGKMDPVNSENATGEELTFNNLSLGYYLVYPKGATSIKKDFASLASITSTTPDGEVKVKSEYPTIEKKADKKSFDYGQEVTYTLTGKVPDTTGYSKYIYQLSDQLSKGLTLQDKSVDVKFGNQIIASNVESKEVTNKDIKITPNVTQGTLQIDFEMLNLQAYKGQEIKVTYKALVNKDAVIGSEGNPNKVTLKYSNNPKNGDDTDTTTDEEKVYTAEINILKVDGKNKATKLEGAEFVLRDKNSDDAKYYKYDDQAGKVTWVADKKDATVKKTDSNGHADFKGLKNGTYYLEEIKAPDGYNLLTGRKEVIVNYENQNPQQIFTVEVENKSGSELPGTGGMGTLAFIIIGGGLGLLAAGLYRRNRQAE
ncbi:SpaH/EbpB family LPXTG-anchored major pilin [Peptococcus simiae]|uniref:SpaH/EbpB family LPXTG-anchored major pilin n=1 Tax=Peptococcus simiae TaxID=1643805 RepID=UPI00397F733F